MTTPENERGTGTDNTDTHDEGSHKRPKRAWVEEIEVTGNQLVERVKELLQDSNTKRVHIKAQDGKELMSVPLTFGVVVGVSSPWAHRSWPHSEPPPRSSAK